MTKVKKKECLPLFRGHAFKLELFAEIQGIQDLLGHFFIRACDNQSDLISAKTVFAYTLTFYLKGFLCFA